MEPVTSSSLATQSGSYTASSYSTEELSEILYVGWLRDVEIMECQSIELSRDIVDLIASQYIRFEAVYYKQFIHHVFC